MAFLFANIGSYINKFDERLSHNWCGCEVVLFSGRERVDAFLGSADE